MSDDNPRGYTDRQLKRIADAPTLNEKMDVELFIANNRRMGERGRLTRPLNDRYGLERISAMEAEIRAEYAAKMADEESEDAMKNGHPAGDMEMIERLRQENG
jgi:hypothetical protein